MGNPPTPTPARFSVAVSGAGALRFLPLVLALAFLGLFTQMSPSEAPCCSGLAVSGATACFVR